MRLLVIGGTSFVGRHAVEVAVADAHEVTVFHRGQTNGDLLAGRIEHRIGDRTTGDYSSLAGAETWDAVLDVSAYVPRHVHQLADELSGRLGHYVHVSSLSAYDPRGATIYEDSPLFADLAHDTEDITDTTYGPLKAACERAATARFGERSTSIVRPTYVCGPYDRSDRFTYWARRMAEGGDVVVLDADAPMQIVDARDLGSFLVHCAASRTAGAFDGVGPWAPTVELLAQITPPGVDAHFIEVDSATLDAAGIELPMIEGDEPALSSRPGIAARAAGLTTRSVADTADATRRWDTDRGSPELSAGPTRAQEADLVRSVGGRR